MPPLFSSIPECDIIYYYYYFFAFFLDGVGELILAIFFPGHGLLATGISLIVHVLLGPSCIDIMLRFWRLSLIQG